MKKGNHNFQNMPLTVREQHFSKKDNHRKILFEKNYGRFGDVMFSIWNYFTFNNTSVKGLIRLLKKPKNPNSNILITVEIKGFPLIENGVIKSVTDNSEDVFVRINHDIGYPELSRDNLSPQEFRKFYKLAVKHFVKNFGKLPDNGNIYTFYNIVTVISYVDKEKGKTKMLKKTNNVKPTKVGKQK